jgi:uncharacterized protein (DUF58 family)
VTLERLERLAVRWQQSFQGLLGGQNVSRFAGVGHEFLDHRHFHPGDDLRSVNWRAYLRLERLFLKMFRTEPRTPVRILLDTSESMACGASGAAPGEAKFPYACRLAAALTYVGLVRLETIVLHPFSETLGESFRAQGGRHRYARAAQFLGALETGGRSDFHRAVRQFCSGVGSPGLVVVLSDFLDESDCAEALQQLADQGHEMHLAQLAGPDDRTPPWDGELELLDAESGELRRVQMDRASALEYAEAYDEYCRGIEYAALKNNGRYLHLTTDAPLEDALYGAVMATGSVTLQ